MMFSITFSLRISLFLPKQNEMRYAGLPFTTLLYYVNKYMKKCDFYSLKTAMFGVSTFNILSSPNIPSNLKKLSEFTLDDILRWSKINMY